jgi:hypothetical protein
MDARKVHMLALFGAGMLFLACDLASLGGEGTGASGASVPGAFPDADEGFPLSKGAGDFLFRSDFEGEDPACWGDRSESGYAKAPCGNWGAIGPAGALLMEDETARSGAKSLQVTFDRNESRGGATLSLSADVAHVRAWYRFGEGFDFGQGIKVGRIRSFNHATQENDIDIIMTVRSSGDTAQCGTTDMADLGLFYNGKPEGYDWGHLIAPVRFERNRWYAVEYAVALNDPGTANGSIRLWVDGREVGSREGLNLRGKAGPAVKLNKIMLGGWYSNGALGNADCADPFTPSTFRMDDVAVGSGYIGTD